MPTELASQEVGYYFLPEQIENFKKQVTVEEILDKNLDYCCQMPGALNIPVGVYGVNAPGDTIGKMGVQCLEERGISGINAWTLSSVCRNRKNLKKFNSN